MGCDVCDGSECKLPEVKEIRDIPDQQWDSA